MSGLGDVAQVVTAVVAAIAVGGSYVQFVLKRSVLPSAELDVDFKLHWSGTTSLVGDVDVCVRNAGQTMLVVTDVRVRARYQESYDAEPLLGPREPCFAHAVFSESETNPESPTDRSSTSGPSRSQSSSAEVSATTPSLSYSAEPHEHPGWADLSPERTFVQPGVTQHYRKPLVLPSCTQLLHVWAAIDYRLELGPMTKLLVGWFAHPPSNLDWRRGISNHTIRRTFPVHTTVPK